MMKKALIILTFLAFIPTALLADSANSALKQMEYYAEESRNLITTVLNKKEKQQLHKNSEAILSNWQSKIKEIRALESPGSARSNHIEDVMVSFYKDIIDLVKKQKKDKSKKSKKEINKAIKKLKELQKKLTDDLKKELLKESGKSEGGSAVPIIDDSPYEEKGIWDR